MCSDLADIARLDTILSPVMMLGYSIMKIQTIFQCFVFLITFYYIYYIVFSIQKSFNGKLLINKVLMENCSQTDLFSLDIHIIMSIDCLC